MLINGAYSYFLMLHPFAIILSRFQCGMHQSNNIPRKDVLSDFLYDFLYTAAFFRASKPVKVECYTTICSNFW